MKNRLGKLEHRVLRRIQMKLIMICNLHKICNQLESVSRFYEGNNFKPCLTEQFFNVLELWCEWGYSITRYERTITWSHFNKARSGT